MVASSTNYYWCKLWYDKGTNNSINVLRRDLRNHALEDAKTREHLAINYATKAEVNSEIGKTNKI